MSEADPIQNKIRRTIDSNSSRKFSDDDPLVIAFIDQLIESDETFYRYYLVWLVLNEHLSKFNGTSPIISGDQIHTSMRHRISAFANQSERSPNVIESGLLQHAVHARLRIDRHPERHMKILNVDRYAPGSKR